MQTFDECRHEHVQAVLVSPAHELVSMDVRMVRPVNALWAVGVPTEASCEGYGYLDWKQGHGLRPYILLGQGADVPLALHVLHVIDITKKWEVEPPIRDGWGTCLVPPWAARMAAESIAKGVVTATSQEIGARG